jgi:beta-glucosidase
LVPFRAAIEEAHAGGVMAAYSSWDGTPNNASRDLLQGILRQEWGFDGIVVSDCGGPEQLLAKQAVVTNAEGACRLAILAGVDNECGSLFKKSLAAAVRKGFLKESDLDANLRDVLRAKFRLGLFEEPGRQSMVWDKLPAYDTPEHRALAREVAAEGSVLLKNEGGLLPLSKELGTIAVIGPNADLGQTGDYSGKTSSNQVVTVLQGVKSHVGSSTKIIYVKGCDHLSPDTSGIAAAVDAAKQADAVILVVGDSSSEKSSTTGENHDGATLEIPGVQRELIKEVQAAGKPVVLVLVNGKPFTLAWETKNVPAILETWYPGEEGGNATADLIFGDRNPSGRLPITFPRHVGQLPLRYDYLPSGRNYTYYDMPFTPQFRFGFGLSYTTFQYSNPSVATKEDGSVVVTADVQNTGARDGDEVAQLYLTDVYTSVITPVIEQKGFQRVSLKKGEQKTVSFTLTPYQLSFLDANMARVVEPGIFRVHIGGASPEPPSGSDGHKLRIGFKNSSQGVSGEFHVDRKFQADFVSTLAAPGSVHREETFPATVTVRNRGNLTDVVEVKLFGGTLLGTHRFEIEPGQSMSCQFSVAFPDGGIQNLTAIVGGSAMTQAVKVSKAAAKKREQ